MIGNLWQDLRYGARMLLKNPGFTLVVVFTLALGIGANTAIFSVVNSVLLKPLAYPEPHQLVKISAANMRDPSAPTAVSAPNFLDWRDQNQSFRNMAAYFQRDVNFSNGGEPERLRAVRASADFFAVIGAAPLLGRAFLLDEDRPGAPPVAILSYGFWQRRFGGQNVLGQAINLDGRSTSIVGILPPDFNYIRNVEVYLPVAADPQSDRLMLFLDVVARLKPGVSLDQATAEMKSIASRLEQQYPATNKDWTVKLVSLQENAVGSIRATLLLLLGAVGFVLLIAIANIANLLLARASSRQKEMALRSALGAGRFRLARQLLTESVILSLAGGLFGLIVAFIGIRSITKFSTNIPRIDEISIDFRVLAFTLGVSLLAGVLFGLAPAIQAGGLDLNESLKEGSKGNAASGKRHLRGALIVTEVSLALMLLVGTGLLLKSFQRLHQIHLGFDPTNVLTFDLALPRVKYADEPRQSAFFEEALRRIRSVPGVEDAGITSTIPLGRKGALLLFYAEGRPARGPEDYVAANYDIISPGYFQAMGIPLLQGRDLSEQDRSDKPGVVVISESMAHRFWPNEDVLNKRMKLGGNNDPKEPWLTIVGIVSDVKRNGLEKREGEATMYTSYLQGPQPYSGFVVRSRGGVTALTGALHEVIRGIDKDQPIAHIRPLDQIVSENFAQRRFSLFLLGIFAAIALVLASVGIYGVMAYTVTQRTPEIGIRMALGARTMDVLKMIIGQGMLITIIGVAIGLVGAFAMTRLMKALLFGVDPTDPLTFGGVAVLLSLVALFACFIPARRATKVDPLVALRYE